MRGELGQREECEQLISGTSGRRTYTVGEISDTRNGTEFRMLWVIQGRGATDFVLHLEM